MKYPVFEKREKYESAILSITLLLSPVLLSTIIIIIIIYWALSPIMT